MDPLLILLILVLIGSVGYFGARFLLLFRGCDVCNGRVPHPLHHVDH